MLWRRKNFSNYVTKIELSIGLERINWHISDLRNPYKNYVLWWYPFLFLLFFLLSLTIQVLNNNKLHLINNPRPYIRMWVQTWMWVVFKERKVYKTDVDTAFSGHFDWRRVQPMNCLWKKPSFLPVIYNNKYRVLTLLKQTIEDCSTWVCFSQEVIFARY